MSQPLYDRLWTSAWGDMQRLGPVHRHLQNLLVPLVRSLSVRTVLEVGCGSGDNLAVLAGSGDYALTGTDIAPAALDRARQRVPHARLQVLDIETQVLPETFDLVMSLQVVEHLAEDRAALAHMARMARRYVLVSTMRGRMRPSEAAIGHQRNYTAEGLASQLAACGLRVERLWGWGFPFYSPLYRTMVEWLPGGPPMGPMGKWQTLVSMLLYQLYRCNIPGRGDVLFALASV